MGWQMHSGTDMAVTNHFLIAFKATPQEEMHAYNCKSNQELMLWELSSLKGQPINTLLNEHSIRQSSECESLCL